MNNLEEYNIKSLLKDDFFNVAILGSSGCGKSTLLKHILNEIKKEFIYVFLFQGSTPSENNDYSNFIWPSEINIVPTATFEKKDKNLEFIRNKIADYLSKITSINQDITDHNKRYPDNQYDKIKTLFLFDDFGKNTNAFNNLLNLNRHALTSFIFLIHKDTDLTTDSREKITHFFVSIKYNLTQIKELFKNLMNSYEEKKNHFNNYEIFNKCFFVLEKDSIKDTIKYINLSQNDIEKIENSNSVFYHCSNERKKIIELLKELSLS